MAESRNYSVLAVDVGSTSAKLGWFPRAGACDVKPALSGLAIGPPRLPTPESMLRLEHARQASSSWLGGLDEWLQEIPTTGDVQCLVASVHERAGRELSERLARHRWSRLAALTCQQMPLEVRTTTPDRVGVDRLLGTVAVNCLRTPSLPAISVDMGTAVTVNLIASDGAFEGGAILPGPGTALRALHDATASLPLLTPDELSGSPPAVGKSTIEAMAAGAFWGGLGAIRELVDRMAGQAGQNPELFLTGGGAQHFARLVTLGDQPARHVPHLVLAGICVVAQGLPAP